MNIYRINDNGTDREMTSDEIAAHKQSAELIMLDIKAEVAAIEAATAAKISARAKLKALGLTDAEIAALVG